MIGGPLHGFAEIEVTKQATIAELKQAIQNYFSHLATEGPCKISWYASHSYKFGLPMLQFYDMRIADL